MKTILFLTLSAAASFGQTLPGAELYFTPGRVLARGDNAAVDPLYRIKSYRIEEVKLDRTVNATVSGRTISTDRAFRIILTGADFPVRAMPAIVWAGDKMLGKAQPNRNLTELTVVTFDISPLQEGATLALSYGNRGPKQSLREQIRYAIRP